jgi:hypothetical protein
MRRSHAELARQISRPFACFAGGQFRMEGARQTREKTPKGIGDTPNTRKDVKRNWRYSHEEVTRGIPPANFEIGSRVSRAVNEASRSTRGSATQYSEVGTRSGRAEPWRVGSPARKPAPLEALLRGVFLEMDRQQCDVGRCNATDPPRLP